MGGWLDRIPLTLLIVGATLMALAPFYPEPHLWQKARMLFAGELTRPEDIFDVLFHSALLILVGIKVKRDYFSSEDGVE
ncbi:MAG: hypothetical protein SH809_10265 [Rhodothermales bacterium]|nr:hypothetical protein [Rhodothermales bacterium]